jgi:hypothetical protein
VIKYYYDDYIFNDKEELFQFKIHIFSNIVINTSILGDICKKKKIELNKDLLVFIIFNKNYYK